MKINRMHIVVIHAWSQPFLWGDFGIFEKLLALPREPELQFVVDALGGGVCQTTT